MGDRRGDWVSDWVGNRTDDRVVSFGRLSGRMRRFGFLSGDHLGFLSLSEG